MTTYTVAWGVNPADSSRQHTRTITSPEQVQGVLDEVAASAALTDVPVLVSVYAGDRHHGRSHPATGLQVLWGHPSRAGLIWLGDEPGYAVEPGIALSPQPIGYDLGELAPHRTRLTPTAARDAVLLREMSEPLMFCAVAIVLSTAPAIVNAAK